MKKIVQICLVMFLALVLVVPVMAQSTTTDDGTDSAKMAELMTQVDNGQMSVEAALTKAISQNISYVAIVAACEARNIPLSKILSAAIASGMSSEVALARMAEDGVTNNQMSAAMSSPAGESGTGLGYTPSQQAGRLNTVVSVTSNPGGSAQGGTVAPLITSTPGGTDQGGTVVPPITSNPGGSDQGGTVVPPITSNPGGSDQGGTVSPSTL